MSAAAKRYGAALFELAQEEGLEERLLRELDGVLACFALEEQYYRLLSLPGVSRQSGALCWTRRSAPAYTSMWRISSNCCATRG